MQISINGQNRAFSKDRVNVSDIIAVQNVKMPDMLSLQINGRQIRSEKFQETFLSDGDEIDYMYRMETCFYCLD